MATSTNQTEPTRPVASYEDHEGNLRAYSPMSPKNNNTRAAIAVPPDKVMPVIVIAGIMGSNLRAKTNPNDEQNRQLNPGEAAWRPPNSVEEGLGEAKIWRSRSPAVRQQILDGDTLEVDPNGPVALGAATDGFVWNEKIARQRGWGEIHSASYGLLLVTLQQNLNRTYRSLYGNPALEGNWVSLNAHDRSAWGVSKDGIGAPLTDDELKKFAQFSYPVYAFGYNWLKSNEVSAQSLQDRIEKIISYWQSKKRDCNGVILVTHSMGGLVARACSKKIPQMIAGVIHGVMPAFGAPACYRRLACGTETSTPSNTDLENKGTEKFAEIAGLTVAETTPVLATAAGPLELLPNHLYPKPWLFAQSFNAEKKPTFLNLSIDDPYELYLEFSSWYRLIDPALADPANKYKGDVRRHITTAVKQAKKFHMEVVGNYYHPNTFVFYGKDEKKLSFGTFRWKFGSSTPNLSDPELKAARFTRYLANGGRQVDLRNGKVLTVSPSLQDVAGDGTVPFQSGQGPEGKVRNIFVTAGYSHQGSYSNSNILMLTWHLIAKVMQDV